MGWEPITYCRECGESFEVYMAPENRICDCCKEFYADMELDRATTRVKEAQEHHGRT